ncbi:MAG: glycosyltransferase family 4 protein [Candidatus Brocadiia bacterium]
MSEPLHILFVIDNFHPLVGGAEGAALESAKALVRRGHEAEVLTMRKRQQWPQEEHVDGVRVCRFEERIPPKPFGRVLYESVNASAARKYFEKELAGNRYDAILLYPIDASFGVARSAAAARSARIYYFLAPLSEEHLLQVRGLLETERRPMVRLMTHLSAAYTARYRATQQRLAILHSDATACPSEYSRELLYEAVPRMRGRRVRLVPLGVDTSRFRPAEDRLALRQELGWAAHETVLFTARRLVPRTGVGHLVRAVGIASEHNPDLRLVVAGKGPLRGRLEGLARRAGARVDFVGLLSSEELIRHYQASDLFVLPSLDLEAFGLVILESMACGTPVLATNRCAMPELLRPLDERLLIPRDDAPAIADTLLGVGAQVAAEPGFRQRCRDYVVSNYSWDHTARGFEELARELIEKRRSS